MSLIKSVEVQKQEINLIIVSALKEILQKGLVLNEKSIGSLEDDISLLMKALASKRKIYDFAVMINFNELLNIYDGIIVYDLINTDDDRYSETINFNF